MNKGDTFKVLDHGYVKYIDSMGTDETIVEAARMSTGKGFISWEPYDGKPDGDQAFLEFLFKNKHTTPFEMCELAIEVQAPIFVFREWHRHRTQSYNELSARYTQMPNLHYVPDASRIVLQSSANKQGSSLAPLGDKEWVEDIIESFKDEQQDVYKRYNDLIEYGLAKEVARVNTPVSRFSRMRAKTDLLNWFKFLNLRQRPDAQWEIRQYADVVANIIEQLFPRSYALYKEWWLGGESFGAKEMEVLKALTIGTNHIVQSYARQFGMTEKQIAQLLTKLLK